METMINTANVIAAKAVQMAKPKVIAAYPITPQTVVVEYLAKHVESGELDAEYICVESEHSAMAATIGAAATGVRTFTATSSHGLLLMHEMVHWAALARLPIVMVNVNRTIGPGWNIWADNNDSMAQRDTGWMQIHCASNQEVFDTIIQAYKLAEDPDIQLPIMINYDGFILSHTSMPFELPDQKDIDAFLPDRVPCWAIDPAHPLSHGNLVPPEYYMEHRASMQNAHNKAIRLLPKIADEWKEKFGTYHGGLIEEYKLDGAEHVIITMGTLGAEAKETVNEMRREGHKVGLARVRLFRPFPAEALLELADGRKSLIVIDRNISPGHEGVTFSELKSVLYGKSDVPVYGYIAGLGGRDVTYGQIKEIVSEVMDGKGDAYNTKWWALKEKEVV